MKDLSWLGRTEVSLWVSRLGDAMDVSRWERYLVWDARLRESMFNPEMEGRPAYLDVDEETLQRLGGGLNVDDAPEDFVLSVRAVALPDIDDWLAPFVDEVGVWRVRRRAYLEAVAKGQRPPDIPPPAIVGILALFVLAAQQMGGQGDFSPIAYYPHLCELLDARGEQQRRRVESFYRKHAEGLWGGLNDWLEHNEGLLGLPSAFALSKRFVGLPMSQSLLREADRRALPDMFSRFGLSPGVDVAPWDMKRFLDDWLSVENSQASYALRSLWGRASSGVVHERIAEIACLELQAWDGSLRAKVEKSTAFSGALLLTAHVKGVPPRLELSFLCRLGSDQSHVGLVVDSAEGKPQLQLRQAGIGTWCPVALQGLDVGSLLGGDLRVRAAESGVELVRRPRRLVAFRRDESVHLLVECEKLQFGEDAVVLVVDQPKLVELTERHLATYARPGFSRRDLRGVPDGWVLYTGVQILSAPPADRFNDDLNPLVPMLGAQLTLAGGLRLPGRLRKWSRYSPPEIRAVAQQADELSVTLRRVGKDSKETTHTRSWETAESALMVSLADEGLIDGDYEIELKVGREVRQQVSLRLRSGETPDVQKIGDAERLCYLVSDPLCFLTSRPWDGKEPVLAEGVITVSGAREVELQVPTADLWWIAPKPVEQKPTKYVLSVPRPDSCVVTGVHILDLGYAGPGTSKRNFVNGVCKSCGLIKRYPTRLQRASAKSGRKTAEPPPRVDFSKMPPTHESSIDWDVAVDSLVHVGGGPFTYLEKIALDLDAGANADSSRLSIYDFTRQLELTGDVDMCRDDQLEASSWSMSPPSLVGLPLDDWMCVGRWTPQAYKTLKEILGETGGSIDVVPFGSGFPRVYVRGVSSSALEEWHGLLQAFGVSILPTAGMDLLRALPRLRDALPALRRIPLPVYRGVQRFELMSASWVDTDHPSKPGAYRLKAGFVTRDVYRSTTDFDSRTVAVSTVHLSKHLAALENGRPLMAYEEAEQALIVPLGAELPGLYSRALFLLSGLEPVMREASNKRRVLVYRGVSAEAASLVFSLFG